MGRKRIGMLCFLLHLRREGLVVGVATSISYLYTSTGAGVNYPMSESVRSILIRISNWDHLDEEKSANLVVLDSTEWPGLPTCVSRTSYTPD